MPYLKKTITPQTPYQFHHQFEFIFRSKPLLSLSSKNTLKIIENKFGSIKYIILYLYCQTNKNEKK